MTQQDKPGVAAPGNDNAAPNPHEQALSADLAPLRDQIDAVDRELLALLRSEEHTSELQSH